MQRVLARKRLKNRTGPLFRCDAQDVCVSFSLFLLGIISKLDYIKDLGIDSIWLSPIYESPMADFGYDVSNHTNIDPMFGSLQDIDDLIESVHNRGY